MITDPFISLAYAKKHVHIETNFEDSDDDLSAKIFEASQIVANHIKVTTIPDAWFAATMPMYLSEDFAVVTFDNSSPPVEMFLIPPGNIRAAVCLMTAELFENREASSTEGLPQAIVALLEGYRDPTLA